MNFQNLLRFWRKSSVGYTNFYSSRGISSSWVKIMLHTENSLPKLSVSALKVELEVVGWSTFVEDSSWVWAVTIHVQMRPTYSSSICRRSFPLRPSPNPVQVSPGGDGQLMIEEQGGIATAVQKHHKNWSEPSACSALGCRARPITCFTD